MSQSNPRTLKQRIFRAGGWTLAGLGLSQALRFGSNLIMTRLLAPEMFGIVAIATIVMVGLAMFSDIGLRQNIVQSKNSGSTAFLNTAWSVQILRGFLLWMIALAVSLTVAAANHFRLVSAGSVYADPMLPYVIAALSFSALISGFESTKLAEASRSLLLHRVIQIDLGSQALGLAVMLCWVLVDRSIWSLVAGGLFSALLRTILSHLFLPGTQNRWHWDDQAFREIIHFGKWIFLSSILGFLVLNGDRLLLGLIVSPAVLGIYVIAFLIYSSVEQVLTKIMANVSFPVFSEVVRDRPWDLKSTYYRVHGVLASATYFGAGVLMGAGQTLINLLYDQRYSQAGWMLEYLAWCLLTIPARLSSQCFMALGMPKLLTRTILIQLVILFLFLPLGFQYFGLRGALGAIVLSYFAALPTIIYYLIKYRLFDLRRELILLPVVVAGMMVAKGINLAVGL
jgi:O-antigen/teichoic acid export membrane protein